MTGPVSLLGVDNLKAMQLAFDEYQATKKPEEPILQLTTFDDQYQTSKSRVAYDDFVHHKGARILFLNTYSSMFELANNILEDDVVAVNPIDNDTNLARLNRNLFFIAKRTEDLAQVLIDALVKHSKKKIYMLFFSGDDFMPFLAKHINESFPQNGKQIKSADYTTGTQDFSTFVSQSLNFKPDAYVLLGYTELGHFMKQVHAQGNKVPFYTPNVSMQSIAKNELEGTYFFNFTYLDGRIDPAKKFLEQYQKKYGEPPAVEWTALQAYDAANIVISAVREVYQKPGLLSLNLTEKLYQIKNYPGTCGLISILTDGTPGAYIPVFINL